MIVMINSNSASAAELVAGALQDHDRALIVGQPSFGKSLLMTPTILPDGSMLMLVVGHLRTPCGRVIQREYRKMSAREYRRGALAERDTMGRPSCKTSRGRTVYGGGGIYPDVRIPEPEGIPAWMSKVSERALLLSWIGGHVTGNATAYPSLEALATKPEPAAGAVEDFRRFAAQQGVSIPAGEETDRLLKQRIVLRVADAKWGTEGFYRVLAAVDPEIKAGVAAFDKAEAVLAWQ
jgi:carboxyl-terminal processing protease